MEERKQEIFRMELVIDKAYLKRTWPQLEKLKKFRLVLVAASVVCLVYSGYVMVMKDGVTLGVPMMAVAFLAFSMALPSLMINQLFGSYQRYKADGKRRISLMEDGVEVELEKYQTTYFYEYQHYRVEEDEHSYYLVRQGQKVAIPKGPCLVGDEAEVGEFLRQRVAAAQEKAALPAEEEDDTYYLEEADEPEETDEWEEADEAPAEEQASEE